MCFLSSAALAAALEYMTASVMVLELSGDATVTLKAAEMPLSQLVTRRSAGRVLALQCISCLKKYNYKTRVFYFWS